MKEEFISLPLQLEVPQNDGEFKLGLMFRESLEKDRGMLFVFETTDRHSFHMRNTFIPLDIAFINEEGVIESIKELDPMSSIPVYPDGDIRYAVEVNRGWFVENGIEIGDIILEDTEETEIDLNEVKDRKGKGSGTKDACYYKVKSRYSVWPSAYASGALVKCRKVGAANWGNSTKKEEYIPEEGINKDPAFDIMRPGGKNSPLNKDLTPKNFKMSGEFPGTVDQFDKKYKLGKYKNQKNIFQKFIEKPIMKDYPTKQEYQDSIKSGTSNQYMSYEPEGEMIDEKKSDWRQELDEKCWPGYEKKGMKTMFGKRYPNCVKKSKKKK